MKTLGIDIGSRNTKLVIFDHTSSQILYYKWLSTDIKPMNTVNSLLELAFKETGLSQTEIMSRAATGYGRKLWTAADHVFSEISCHSSGIVYHFPQARTIIDVGGQDSKVISLSANGKVLDFAMNDKCAAGTGRFLEMTAIRLGVDVSQLSELANQASRELSLNSTCVVFAESEIVGLMAENQSAANIIRAVHRSIAKRIFSQLSSIDHHPIYTFTGGVAQNPDLAHCLQAELGSKLLIPPEPEITGALGAAILAKQ